MTSPAGALLQTAGIREDGSGNTDRILLGVSEAAGLLSVSRATVYSLIASQGLPSVRIGGRRLIPRAQLVAWVGRMIAEQSSECALLNAWAGCPKHES